MTYNLTFLDNATLGSVITNINLASDGWMIGLILIVTWIIIIISFYNKSEIDDLLIGSGFIMALASGLLFTAALIPPVAILFPMLSLIIGLLMKYMG